MTTKQVSFMNLAKLGVCWIAEDRFSAESGAGKGSAGSSRLHTTDPPAAEQSEWSAATMSGKTKELQRTVFWLRIYFYWSFIIRPLCRENLPLVAQLHNAPLSSAISGNLHLLTNIIAGTIIKPAWGGGHCTTSSVSQDEIQSQPGSVTGAGSRRVKAEVVCTRGRQQIFKPIVVFSEFWYKLLFSVWKPWSKLWDRWTAVVGFRYL